MPSTPSSLLSTPSSSPNSTLEQTSLRLKKTPIWSGSKTNTLRLCIWSIQSRTTSGRWPTSPILTITDWMRPGSTSSLRSLSISTPRLIISDLHGDKYDHWLDLCRDLRKSRTSLGLLATNAELKRDYFKGLWGLFRVACRIYRRASWECRGRFAKICDMSLEGGRSLSTQIDCGPSARCLWTVCLKQRDWGAAGSINNWNIDFFAIFGLLALQCTCAPLLWMPRFRSVGWSDAERDRYTACISIFLFLCRKRWVYDLFQWPKCIFSHLFWQVSTAQVESWESPNSSSFLSEPIAPTATLLYYWEAISIPLRSQPTLLIFWSCLLTIKVHLACLLLDDLHFPLSFAYCFEHPEGFVDIGDHLFLHLLDWLSWEKGYLYENDVAFAEELDD